MTARRFPTALLCALLVGVLVSVVVGCGTAGVSTADQNAPTSADGASPGAVRTPGAVSADQRFTFDDIAEYPDGLEIEVAGAVAVRADATDRGAESTGGEMVSASIRVGNNTEHAYDPTSVRVFATYGRGTAAPLVLDATGDLQRGFTASIPVGGEATTPMGFAIPVTGLAKVTFTVDPGDIQHEPVSFTGRVERQ